MFAFCFVVVVFYLFFVVVQIYHASEGWLVANGNLPEKAKCIEILDIKKYVDWRKYSPQILLHEMTHSYHHRTFGTFGNIIKESFNGIDGMQYIGTVENF